jgi:predicted ATPase
LLRYLRDKQLLLLLDNFEQLMDAANLVSVILQSAPEVKILTTSHEKLNLQGETVFYVGGMAVPDRTDPQTTYTYDAINLFIQSAARVRPGFDPSPEELAEITAICQSVGGMPLAIELAAAWLSILSVHEVADELRKSLDILTSDARDTPERHRSIRTVVDRSWSLLDQDEQEVFLRLSIFQGGFSRQAAQQVAGASLRQLADLAHKSLLSHDPDSARFTIHQLLRQYAHEQLERMPEVSSSGHESHGAYFAEFMDQRDLSSGMSDRHRFWLRSKPILTTYAPPGATTSIRERRLNCGNSRPAYGICTGIIGGIMPAGSCTKKRLKRSVAGTMKTL